MRVESAILMFFDALQVGDEFEATALDDFVRSRCGEIHRSHIHALRQLKVSKKVNYSRVRDRVYRKELV